MCRIHFASRTDALRTSTVQPKAGRSENIYWLCKVSLLLPPSSLGLDGQEQPIRRFEDIQEVQKAYISLFISNRSLDLPDVVRQGEILYLFPYRKDCRVFSDLAR